MHISKKLLLSLVAIPIYLHSAAQTITKPSIKSKTSFAIVVDSDTYHKAKKEIDAYRGAVEKKGLGTYIIDHKWSSPDEIRSILQGLYQQKDLKLEGTVLIGDIPIVMVRDAQYLTSAFKMNQKIRWDKSSVPSDRYYDDFDLKFTFLKQDTAVSRRNYYYYTLDAQSPQYINMDIYSARIKPPVAPGEDAVEKIKTYLLKVVRDKEKVSPLRDMIASTGHGYNSNAINSVIGDQMALRNQFPELFKVGNSFKYLNFRQDNFLKFNLLRELKRPGVDVAFMSGHGTWNLQLLNGYPETSSPTQSMENVARYLRGKVRDAKADGRDVAKTKENFKKSLGVSDKWMDDAFDQETIDADSIFNEQLDLHFYDIKDAGIQAKFVYINSCLTGSYHLPEYIAGYYPFSNNETIVALASSIGILQDLWPTELMGVIQHGVSIGNWMKHIAYLETHLLGDPTFKFAAKKSNTLDEHIAQNSTDMGYWKKMLQENDADLQSVALVYLTKNLSEEEVSPLLKKYYVESGFESTRMQAFDLLRQFENKTYFEVLHLAKQDSYEFIRRQVSYDLNEFGGAEFAKDLISLYVSDPHSNRITHRVNWSISFLDPDVLKNEINAQIRNNPAIANHQKIADDLDKIIELERKKVQKMALTLKDKSQTEKERLNVITTMRLYRYHLLVPNIIAEIQDTTNTETIRVAALEALSWFPLSYQRQTIFDACEQIIQNQDNPKEVKYQALKTKNVMAGYAKK